MKPSLTVGLIPRIATRLLATPNYPTTGAQDFWRLQSCLEYISGHVYFLVTLPSIPSEIDPGAAPPTAQ